MEQTYKNRQIKQLLDEIDDAVYYNPENADIVMEGLQLILLRLAEIEKYKRNKDKQ